jgi:hypothetical protein
MHFYHHLYAPEETFWLAIHTKIALSQVRLTLEFFVVRISEEEKRYTLMI